MPVFYLDCCCLCLALSWSATQGSSPFLGCLPGPSFCAGVRGLHLTGLCHTQLPSICLHFSCPGPQSTFLSNHLQPQRSRVPSRATETSAGNSASTAAAMLGASAWHQGAPQEVHAVTRSDGNDVSRRELERQIQELRRDKAQQVTLTEAFTALPPAGEAGRQHSKDGSHPEAHFWSRSKLHWKDSGLYLDLPWLLRRGSRQAEIGGAARSR